MLNYLNTDKCYKAFKELIGEDYFVDKSLILTKLNKLFGTTRKYICITRPRRFGKTTMANLLRSIL